MQQQQVQLRYSQQSRPSPSRPLQLLHLKTVQCQSGPTQTGAWLQHPTRCGVARAPSIRSQLSAEQKSSATQAIHRYTHRLTDRSLVSCGQLRPVQLLQGAGSSCKLQPPTCKTDPSRAHVPYHGLSRRCATSATPCTTSSPHKQDAAAHLEPHWCWTATCRLRGHGTRMAGHPVCGTPSHTYPTRSRTMTQVG